MPKQQKVTRLLASTVDCKLEVDGGHALELKLAWTMRAVIAMERRLREQGILVNVVQRPGQFWSSVDASILASSIWACSLQEHPEYRDENGYAIVESFLTPENYGYAYSSLRKAFLESLSEERRNTILAAEKKAAEETEGGEGNEEPQDPTPAPPQ